MKRGKFLASLAAIAVAPLIQVDIAPIPPPPIITNPEHFTRRALTPEEVLRIYNETGNLVYCNTEIVDGAV